MNQGLKRAAVTSLYLMLASCALAQTAQNPDPSKWMCRNLADSGGFVYQGETIFGSQACRPIPQVPVANQQVTAPSTQTPISQPATTSAASEISPTPSSPAPVPPVQSSSGNGIVEKQNVPLAMTIFMPEKNPEVSTRIRLAVFKMKVAPIVAQTTNHEKKEIGVDVKVTEAIGGQQFTNAAVAFTADGESLGTPAFHSWTPNSTMGNYAAQTVIENSSDVVHRIAKAKEAYLTVLLPGVQAPFNQISFKLSSGQLANFKRMADKYDALDPHGNEIKQ
jgi:hypothetical protein